jgi:hypothetical protein
VGIELIGKRLHLCHPIVAFINNVLKSLNRRGTDVTPPSAINPLDLQAQVLDSKSPKHCIEIQPVEQAMLVCVPFGTKQTS